MARRVNGVNKKAPGKNFLPKLFFSFTKCKAQGNLPLSLRNTLIDQPTETMIHVILSNPLRKNALQVAVDSAIDATDLLTSSSEPEDVKLGQDTLDVLKAAKALLEDENLEVLVVDDKSRPDLFIAVDALLDEQRELLEDEDLEEDERKDISERVEQLAILLGYLDA